MVCWLCWLEIVFNTSQDQCYFSLLWQESTRSVTQPTTCSLNPCMLLIPYNITWRYCVNEQTINTLLLLCLSKFFLWIQFFLEIPLFVPFYQFHIIISLHDCREFLLFNVKFSLMTCLAWVFCWNYFVFHDSGCLGPLQSIWKATLLVKE